MPIGCPHLVLPLNWDDEEFIRVTRKKYLIDKKHDENSLMTKIEFQLVSRGLIQKHLSKGNMSSFNVE